MFINDILSHSRNHLKQFQNIFNVQIDSRIPIRNYTNQSLWQRGIYKIGTCSNHIESAHQKLNFKVMRSKNVNERFLILLKYISERFTNSKSSRNAHDAIKTLKKIKEKVNVDDHCNQRCSEMKKYYSQLYGFEFPCIHDIEKFDEKKIPEPPIFIAEPFLEINEEKVVDSSWCFCGQNKRIEFKLSCDEIQWESSNKVSWKPLSFLKVLFKDQIEKKSAAKQYILNSFIHFSFNVFGKYHYEEQYIREFQDYLTRLIDNKSPEEYLMKCKVNAQNMGLWNKPLIIYDSVNTFIEDDNSNLLLEKEIIDNSINKDEDFHLDN